MVYFQKEISLSGERARNNLFEEDIFVFFGIQIWTTISILTERLKRIFLPEKAGSS